MLQNLYSWIKQGLASIKGFNTDLHEFFVSEGITASDFNTELLDWINQELGTSYKFLADAQYAYAASLLAPSISDVKGYYEGASLDLDFVRNAGWNGTDLSTAESLLSVTRASAGYAENIDGSWTSFASGEARITNKGLLVEEARTNEIRNNSMQGAVAGTPGTMPTNWNSPFTGGLTRTVVGAGTENGVDYIDLRFSGTSNSTSVQIYFGTTTDISASNGQAWAHSAFVSLVGGTFDDVSSALFFINQRDGGGAFISNVYGTSFISSITSNQLRVADVITTNSASIAYFLPGIFLGITNGAAIDFTLRIGWPQAEEGAFVTSPIRTTTAAATRAADVIGLAFSGPDTEFTLFGDALIPADIGGAATKMLVDTNDGTYDNRVLIRNALTQTTASGVVVAGGVTGATQGAGSLVAGTLFKIALAAAENDAIAAVDGSLSAGDTSVTVPTGIDTMSLGTDRIGAVSLNGYLRRVAYFPSRLTDAQLQALTS